MVCSFPAYNCITTEQLLLRQQKSHCDGIHVKSVSSKLTYCREFNVNQWLPCLINIGTL